MPSDPPAAPRVHLDAASGLPLHPRAREVWITSLERGWADPTKQHTEGRAARLMLEDARQTTAEIIGCEPAELSFVSSGTAACRIGVLGVRRGRDRAGADVVRSAVEHSAITAATDGEAGAAHGAPTPATHVVGVDAFGQIEAGAWRDAVRRPGVAVACLQAANHEVGTVQPLEAAAEVCREAGVPLVVDAAASVGWVAPPSEGDVLVASAHKWGGPAGVGVLVVRGGTPWRHPWPSDAREGSMPGFANIAAVLAAAAALQAVEAERQPLAVAMHRMTSELRREILATIPDVDVAGHPDLRLPHIVNFSCLHVDGEALVADLDRQGFAVSSGSASPTMALEASRGLQAMGVLSHGNVRVSISPTTTPEDLWRFVDAAATTVPRLRAATGIAPSNLPSLGRHRGDDD